MAESQEIKDARERMKAVAEATVPPTSDGWRDHLNNTKKAQDDLSKALTERST